MVNHVLQLSLQAFLYACGMHAAPHAIRAFACYALAQKCSKLGCIHYRLSMYIHGFFAEYMF